MINVRNLKLRVEADDYLGFKKKLKLQGKELNPMPPELFHLTDLEVLEASPERESCLDFSLRDLPRDIGRLTNLRILILDTGSLTMLPAEIGYLIYLERLYLSNNDLRNLPPEFSKLENIRSLHLANNEFRDFPLEICCLENLEFLDMTDNKIKAIPQEIQLLTKMTSFLFYCNKLRKVPMGLCKLKLLRTLWLGKNKLRKLPHFFGRLSNLDWGEFYKSANIDENPLMRPPVEVARQGPAAIRRFFDDRGKGWDGVNESEDEDEWVPLSDSDDDDNGGVSNFF
ncbi:uncharacterized protein LOC134841107 [Symsagittifera roscoffensis]|uniref:uncharacterized protein LOC134841107 n=1 Tax=Symsagittifera roscoffensis TaxID=84072 RepID=UPI00307C5600